MRKQTWRELCEAIMQEKDPHRLLSLVEELNRTLAQRERELQDTSKGLLLEPE